MSIRVKKTEHAGAKKGQGAYWGPKWLAKAGSKQLRRMQGKAEIAEAVQADARARWPAVLTGAEGEAP